MPLFTVIIENTLSLPTRFHAVSAVIEDGLTILRDGVGGEMLAEGVAQGVINCDTFSSIWITWTNDRLEIGTRSGFDNCYLWSPDFY